MPSVIRIGARVSVAVGPLPQDWLELGHRKQATWTGLVVAFHFGKVLACIVGSIWPGIDSFVSFAKVLGIFQFLEYSIVSETELQQIQQRFLPLQPEPPMVHPELANTNHTTAAVVEQECAPLATVQNAAIAQNNAVGQQPPPATSTSLQWCNDQPNAQPLQLNPWCDERQEEDAKQAADPDSDENEELHYDGDNNVFVGLDNYQDGHNEHHQKYFWVWQWPRVKASKQSHGKSMAMLPMMIYLQT